MQHASHAHNEDRRSLPEKIFRPYMEYMHGKRKASHQYDFYRCCGCRGILNWKKLNRGGCDCDTGNKIKPAKLTKWEMFKILVLPWTI